MIDLKKTNPFLKYAILASTIGIVGGCHPQQHSHPEQQHSHTASNANRVNGDYQQLPLFVHPQVLDDKCFIQDDVNLRTMPIKQDEWVVIDINDDGGFFVYVPTEKHISNIGNLYKDFLIDKGASLTQQKSLLKLDSNEVSILGDFTTFLKKNGYLREVNSDLSSHFKLNLRADTKIWFYLVDDKWEFPTHGVFNVGINPANIPNGMKVPFAFSSGDFSPELAKKLLTINYQSVKARLKEPCEYKYDLRVDVVNGGFKTTIIIDPPIKDDGTGHSD